MSCECLLRGPVRVTDRQAPTLAEYYPRWLKRLETKLRATTIKRYRYILESHCGPLMARRLDEISRGVLKDWVAGLHAEGYSRKSMSLQVAVMRALLGEALEDELVGSNPAMGLIKSLRLPQHHDAESPPPLAMTSDELARTLEAARKLFPADGYPCLLLMSHTGVRIGEALGAKWTDIDWEAHKLRVERQILVTGFEAPPKSARGRRSIDLPALVMPVLRSHRTRQREWGMAHGRDAGPYVVFPHFLLGQSSSEGARSRIVRWLNESVTEAGIKQHFHPHCLRHTFATLHVDEALRLGAETRIKWLCDQLGHATIKETLDTYVRHRQVSDPGAADRFAQAIQARRQIGLFGKGS